MFDFLLGNDVLSAVVAFVIVLIPAVIVHELGHFLVAKAVGITVLEFGIGFPPRMTRLFSWGETEFTLNWIPLGGFVRPLGEDFVRPVDEEKLNQDNTDPLDVNSVSKESKLEGYISEREELAQRGILDTMAVNEAKPGARILFFVAGAVANFITAIFLFMIIGLLGVPEEIGARVWVVDVAPTSTFAQAGLQTGDFIEAINDELFASEEALIVRLTELQDQETTLRIVRPGEDGEITTRTLTVIPDQEVENWLASNTYVRVLSVAEGTPAELAGLQPGDLIAGINGSDITQITDPIRSLQQAGSEFAGQEITLSIIRERQLTNVRLTPQEDPPPGVGRIGIGIDTAFGDGLSGMVYSNGAAQVEMIPQPLGDAFVYGIDRTASVFTLLAEFPSRLLQGETEPGEARIISIVGVTQIGGELLQTSIEDNDPYVILQYIALISIALGVTNLLPIPALDGGRILFVLVEIVRGQPIPPEQEGVVHLAGLIFLLSVAVIFIVNDIVNPLTDVIP